MHKDIDLLYKSLSFSLGQEYEYYQKLLKYLEEEELIIKKCTLEHILEHNARKEVVLLSLHMASEMRAKAVKKIVSFFNLDEPASMTQIIAHAQNSTRQNLIDYQVKFADVIAKIKIINEHNRNMITFSLTHVRNTFNYINSLVSSNPNYDHRGQIKAENLQGRLISQAG